jgi:AraC-like DNA-binding protein
MSDPLLELNRAERGTWQHINGTWRRLHGCFPNRGASIEWHDFRVDQPLAWSRSFHAQSLEICLNFSGHGHIGREKTACEVGSSRVAIYTTAEAPLPAVRQDGSIHRFITLELSANFLRGELVSLMDGLLPEVRKFIEHPDKTPSLIGQMDLAPHLLFSREHLLNPPVPESALPFWYSGKITEILSSLLFQPGATAELFCKKHLRLNREICERMLYLLQRDMENPPPLELLAKEFGRSPFQLSRMFSEITGQTIPATLRRLRIERAAKLLRETAKPVTEIAFEVGYSSIGAFNKAFGEHFGKSPSAYRVSDS